MWCCVVGEGVSRLQGLYCFWFTHAAASLAYPFKKYSTSMNFTYSCSLFDLIHMETRKYIVCICAKENYSRCKYGECSTIDLSCCCRWVQADIKHRTSHSHYL